MNNPKIYSYNSLPFRKPNYPYPAQSSFACLKNIFHPCFFVGGIILILSSCSLPRQISKQATKVLLKDSAISTGHIGISIYEPATNTFWYNYDATKYFVPASNTKLFSLYAGMKYLGDSLIGIRYMNMGNGAVKIFPTGDPTFLHPDYKNQPVYDFLKRQQEIIYCSQLFIDGLGKGWAWDDYLDDYMVQRSEFPIYGNLIRIMNTDTGISIIPKTVQINKQAGTKPGAMMEYNIGRPWDKNEVTLSVKLMRSSLNNYYEIPFVPGLYEVPNFLSDTIKRVVTVTTNKTEDSTDNNDKRLIKIFSQPSDSLYKTMMHRSDNFFAEQTLLMASNELLGYMDDGKIIDTILNNDLKDIPQKPKWVDGSGLSRYNLFTPQSFVYLLNKMKNEFGLERIKNILPTGGEGTLKAYYKKDAGFIFAKTGSLSNHCALSGFLITRKNKLLIFSILANHYQTGATPIRRAIEKFLMNIRERY